MPIAACHTLPPAKASQKGEFVYGRIFDSSFAVAQSGYLGGGGGGGERCRQTDRQTDRDEDRDTRRRVRTEGRGRRRGKGEGRRGSLAVCHSSPQFADPVQD